MIKVSCREAEDFGPEIQAAGYGTRRLRLKLNDAAGEDS